METAERKGDMALGAKVYVHRVESGQVTYWVTYPRFQFFSRAVSNRS
jgi:hypothetical protein